MFPLSLPLSVSLFVFVSVSLSISLSSCFRSIEFLSASYHLFLFILSLFVYFYLSLCRSLTIHDYFILYLLYCYPTVSHFSNIMSHPYRGRFDPTAYQQRKDEILREKFRRSVSRSNSSSRGKHRYYDGDAIGQRTSNR